MRTALGIGLLSAAACASRVRPDPADVRPLPMTPGLGLVGTRVIVLPLSSIRHGDTKGWADSIASPRDFLLDFNAHFERALTARVPRTSWIFPAAIQKIAGQNPGYLADPFGADPTQFAPDRYRSSGKLEDPLAGDLRTYTSFVDARVALVPVELRFFPRPIPIDHPLPPAVLAMHRADSVGHVGRPVLRLAIVDTRSMMVLWVSDVIGEPVPALTPDVMAKFADQVARLLATQ